MAAQKQGQSDELIKSANNQDRDQPMVKYLV